MARTSVAARKGHENMEVLTTSVSPLAQELHALKSELHRTLARLSAEPSEPPAWASAPRSPWSRESVATSAASPVTTTTTSTASPLTLRLVQNADTNQLHSSPMQTHSLHRLVGAVRQRREVEPTIARDLEIDTESTADLVARERHQRHKARYEQRIRREIEALRLQRKRIIAQIDQETNVGDVEDEVDRQQGAPHQHVGADSHRRTKSNEFSIEGVVRLAAMHLPQQPPNKPHVPTPTPTAPTPTAPTPTAPTIQLIPPTHLHHAQCSTFGGAFRHDALQDVFSIQLKFAETMLQLEKSIQVRDSLLTTTRSHPRRHRRRVSNMQSFGHSRLQSTIYEDRERAPEESSDDESEARFVSSDETSDATLTRIMQRHRRRQQPAPTNTSAQSTPTTNSTSGSSPPDANRRSSPVIHQHQQLAIDANFSTPTDATTNKQVRFRETPDKYSTPVIARNISFDQESVDSTDDEQPTFRRSMVAPPEKARTANAVTDDEVLSFLEGSSVCSADLCDESFLLAFEALRRELRTDNPVAPTPTPTVGVSPRMQDTDAAEEMTNPIANEAALQQRKCELTLDIQSLTAQLVLATATATRQRLQQSLDALRRQLGALQATNS